MTTEPTPAPAMQLERRRGRKIALQALVNSVARSRHPRYVRHSEVDTTGDVDVPVDLNVEGDDRGIMVWAETP